MQDSAIRIVKRGLWFLGLLLLLGVVTGAITALVLVDDWGRDFTQNSATTSDEATDPLLRAIRTTADVEAVLKLLHSFPDEFPRWKVLNAERKGASGRVSLVRTTRLWSFKDDVNVTIDPRHDDLTHIHIRSSSRVGKGDLGQNPRNIRELNGWLREHLPDAQ